MATFTAQFLVNDTSGSFEGFSGEVTVTETITLGSPTTATVNGQYRGPAPAL
jgi:hypothetical protein